MLERANNLVFTNLDSDLPIEEVDHLVLLRPGQYLKYDKLSEGHSQIFNCNSATRSTIDSLVKCHFTW